jgi:hypothetical protein
MEANAPMGTVAPDGLGMAGACRLLEIAGLMPRLAACDGVPAAVVDTAARECADALHEVRESGYRVLQFVPGVVARLVLPDAS